VGVYPARLSNDVAQTTNQPWALAVVSLEEDGPAMQAGLAVGDVILSVDSQSIDSPWALRAALLERAGQPIRIDVLRSSQIHPIEVPVGVRP
jgi:S1-C subfamily serine protease